MRPVVNERVFIFEGLAWIYRFLVEPALAIHTAWQDDATVESIVGDEFGQSFSRAPEDEMVQLDHREDRAVLAIVTSLGRRDAGKAERERFCI